jgi:gliding motility-associated lipoprotein GldH
MKTLALSLGILLLALVSSCDKAPLYTKSYSFKNNEWKQDVKPVFRVHIPDTTRAYNITITLRTTTDYAYNNLWFFLHSRTPKGQTGREPIEVVISNPDGSWAGEKSGTIVSAKLIFKHRKFPQIGWYTFTFEQGITDKIAKDIMDISYTVALDDQQANGN